MKTFTEEIRILKKNNYAEISDFFDYLHTVNAESKYLEVLIKTRELTFKDLSNLENWLVENVFREVGSELDAMWAGAIAYTLDFPEGAKYGYWDSIRKGWFKYCEDRNIVDWVYNR